MSKSSITIDRDDIGDPADWLHNEHAGDILSSEFMVPLGLSAESLAHAINADADYIAGVVAGSERMSGELDIRLARYFRMSPGFFLGLQIDYEILEAKRALRGQLDRIVPRAA